MIAYFNLPAFPNKDNRAELYYRINNCLHLSEYFPTIKSVGVYAIFKGDVCYYVGQSSNLGNRLATHIEGAYAMADRIVIFCPPQSWATHFYEKSNTEQEDILLLNEQWLIRKMLPRENIKVVSPIEVHPDWAFQEFMDSEEYGYSAEELASNSLFTIYLNEGKVTILDSEECFQAIDDRAISSYRAEIEYRCWKLKG